MAAGLVGTSGSAAIPTTALDPPDRAASPAVPALSGPGPRLRWPSGTTAPAISVRSILQHEVGRRQRPGSDQHDLEVGGRVAIEISLYPRVAIAPILEA